MIMTGCQVILGVNDQMLPPCVRGMTAASQQEQNLLNTYAKGPTLILDLLPSNG